MIGVGTYSESQTGVLLAFLDAEEAGLPPPTLRELCKRFEWSSTGTARDHVKSLGEKSMLARVGAEGTARNWSLSEAGRALAKRARKKGEKVGTA